MAAIVGAAVSELNARRVAETRLLGQVSVEKIPHVQRVTVDDDPTTAVVFTVTASLCRRTTAVHSRHHRRQ